MNIKTANRLCELRKKHGLSQEALADKLGVSRQAVSKWERSESSPDTDNLIQLADLYGISLDELLNGDDAIDIIEENIESDKQNKIEIDDEVIFDDGEETISASKGKVTFKDDEGNTVTIQKGKATVIDKNGKVKELSKDSWKNCKHGKIDRIAGEISGITALLVIIAYIVLGLLSPAGYGFAHYWFLFICIPLPGSFYKACALRKAKEFAYPVLVAAVYCALGMFLGLWHPLWVLFITIPVFYIFVNMFRKHDEDDDEDDDFE